MIKSLRLLKALLLTCVMLPLSAGAVVVGNLTYYLNAENHTAAVNGWAGGTDAAVGQLVIPTSIDFEGKSYIVTTIGPSAFNNCKGLSGSLIIPETITSIGSNAFQGCCGLDGTLTLPESLTNIGMYAFYGCKNLVGALDMPNSITSVGRYAFSGCAKLTSVHISEGIKVIERFTFNDCSSLTSIDIPASVTSIGTEAFSGCSHLASVSIPNGVLNIERESFKNCSSLATLEIPASVESVGFQAFANCSNLKVVTVLSDKVKYESDIFRNDNIQLVLCPESMDCTSLGSSIPYIRRFNPNGAKLLEDGTLLTDKGKTLFFAPVYDGTYYAIPEGVTTIAPGAFGPLYLSNIITPRTATGCN